MTSATKRGAGGARANGSRDQVLNEHEAVQAILAARYQSALARAGGDRTAVDEDGRDALAALVDDISPLLNKILFERLHWVYGAAAPRGLAEECHAEMVAAVVEAAAEFDPARCPAFYSWVTGEQGCARTALKKAINFASGRDGLDPRALRALTIASRAEANLEQELGRPPLLAELQQAMTDYCYQYQYDRLTPEQQQLPEAEWRKLVHTKLSNSSMIANIARIDTLRQLAAGAVSPEEFASGWDFVDAAQEPSPAASARSEDAETAHELGDLLAVGVAGMSPRNRQIVAARLVGRDGEDASLSAVAGRYRVTVAEVKDLVASASSRLAAAHAHYAFLSPSISSQFEEAVPASSNGGGVAAILARLQQPVPA